jgi:hypothetical protein
MLAIRSNLGLQNDKVDFEPLRLDNAVDEVCEIGFASASEENRQSVFLLYTQLN